MSNTDHHLPMNRRRKARNLDDEAERRERDIPTRQRLLSKAIDLADVEPREHIVGGGINSRIEPLADWERQLLALDIDSTVDWACNESCCNDVKASDDAIARLREKLLGPEPEYVYPPYTNADGEVIPGLTSQDLDDIYMDAEALDGVSPYWEEDEQDMDSDDTLTMFDAGNGMTYGELAREFGLQPGERLLMRGPSMPKDKAPHPAGPGAMPAYSLARMLGVSTHTLINTLATKGEYVHNANSLVPAPVAKHLLNTSVSDSLMDSIQEVFA